MSVQVKDVTYRHIAKMLASALPIEGEQFGERVEANLQIIKGLQQAQKTALKMAYIFSRKVPRQEREDMFQDIALTLLKASTPDERLAYAIARCDWKDWYKKYSIRQHYSLDSVVEDSDGNPVAMGELIVGESEFELKMDGKLDASIIWEKLPEDIKAIVQKRLLGTALLNTERAKLSYWVKTKGYQLLLQAS
jgi:hypothetical protein